MSDAMIMQIVIFLTTVLGIVVQLYRENRARRWAKEDRDEARRHQTAITEKIDENTQLSRDAFDAANHVNEKIATITEQVTVPILETKHAVDRLANMPIQPIAPIRAEDAEAILRRRTGNAINRRERDEVTP